MKTTAVILPQFGEPLLFQNGEIELPPLAENEVLVQVKASSYNPADKWLRTGAFQEFMPLELPIVLGWDFAGIVQEVGKNVSAWQVGDEVFGRLKPQRFGTNAHHLIIDQQFLVRKPQNVSFEQAAALVITGSTAYQALFDLAKLKACEKVFVHGGAGGVGSQAVQLAKWVGAEVFATASGQDLEKVGKLGADHAIDYRLQDFRQIAPLVDVVVDTVGGENLVNSLAILAKGGRLISVAEPLSEAVLQQAAERGISAQFIVSENKPKQLAKLIDLVAQGKLQVDIHHILSLNAENVRATHENPRGKTVFITN